MFAIRNFVTCVFPDEQLYFGNDYRNSTKIRKWPQQQPQMVQSHGVSDVRRAQLVQWKCDM